MKKVFLFFGIFAACLVLCWCALSACNEVTETAEAYTTLRTFTGLVYPNVLGTNDFSNVVYGGGTPSYDFNGIWCPDSMVSNLDYDSASGTLEISFSQLGYGNNVFLYIYYTPGVGYFYPSVSYSSYTNVGGRLYWVNADNGLGEFANPESLVIGNGSGVCIGYSASYGHIGDTSRHIIGLCISATNSQQPVTGYVLLNYVKMEKQPVDPGSRYYAFSGFAIPGITYQESGGGVTPDPVPGYWDDWDGVVRPNRLRNSSEFVDGTGWVLPSDAVIDEYLITVSSSTDPVLIKNRTSRSYEPNQGESLTLSCYLTDISGSAKLMLTGTGGTLLSDTNDLVEGLNYVTFELDTLGGVEVTPEFAIYLSANSSVSIDWVKMERGGLFTGYVVNVDELYDLAYDQGFLDGSQAYAFRSFEYNFDNVETNWIQEGWSDWGISDEHELSEVFFSLKSYWFEEQGYNITSNGRFMLFETSNNVTHYGVLLYVSAGEITSISDVYNTEYPIVTVQVWEDRIGFGVRDSNFPDPWNPIQYPTARKVLINCQLGIQQWLDNVSSAADKMGYQRGLDEGYASGRESGYRDGFNYGYEQTQNGTWRGMFSALIGVPITYLVSLFNFEILGFNFLSVFKTIVVISLFLFIVKALLGKVSA